MIHQRKLVEDVRLKLRKKIQLLQFSWKREKRKHLRKNQSKLRPQLQFQIILLLQSIRKKKSQTWFKIFLVKINLLTKRHQISLVEETHSLRNLQDLPRLLLLLQVNLKLRLKRKSQLLALDLLDPADQLLLKSQRTNLSNHPKLKRSQKLIDLTQPLLFSFKENWINL